VEKWHSAKKRNEMKFQLLLQKKSAISKNIHVKSIQLLQMNVFFGLCRAKGEVVLHPKLLP
jgi:hypothetical protein